MGVIEIKDSDAIRRPDTSGGHVFSVKDVMSSCRPLTKEPVQIEMFPDVFDEGLGLLEGEYHIHPLPGEVKSPFAYLGKMLPSEEVKSLELVDHTENLRVSPSRLTRIEQESALDPVCADLRQVILEGWPDNTRQCHPVLSPFY